MIQEIRSTAAVAHPKGREQPTTSVPPALVPSAGPAGPAEERRGGAPVALLSAVLPPISLSCFALLGASTIATAAPAVTGPSDRPPPAPFRLEEDWRFLRDATRRTAPLDRVKYLELDNAGSVTLTLGGEFRHRWEYYRNEAWGARPADGNGYHLLRAMLHADVRAGDAWRAYVDLKSALAEGKVGPLRVPDRDSIDLHQAFLERRLALSNHARVLLRVGRQELNYGSARLITFRDGPNARQAFDAALVRLDTSGWKVDSFYARPAETEPGAWDDGTDTRQLIYGIYGVTTLPRLGGARLDLYVLGYDRDNARFVSGSGNEKRFSAGARFSGRRGAFDFNFEGLWQWGEFRGRDIRAWTLSSDSGWTLADVPGKPRLFLKANLISGDKDPADAHLGTFNALYPRGAYFGDIGLLGPANLLNVHPGVTVNLGSRVTASVDAVLYWRESRGDGLYNAGGALIRSPGLARSRHIGTQADAVLAYRHDAYLTVELTYARFWSGAFLRDTGPAEDVDYVSLLSRFRF